MKRLVPPYETTCATLCHNVFRTGKQKVCNWQASMYTLADQHLAPFYNVIGQSVRKIRDEKIKRSKEANRQTYKYTSVTNPPKSDECVLDKTGIRHDTTN